MGVDSALHRHGYDTDMVNGFVDNVVLSLSVDAKERRQSHLSRIDEVVSIPV